MANQSIQQPESPDLLQLAIHLHMLLDEIAEHDRVTGWVFLSALKAARARAEATGELEDAEIAALLDAQEIAARMGWLADEAARMAGWTPSRGGAEWLMPSGLRPGEIASRNGNGATGGEA